LNQLSIAQHGMWITARTGAATAYHLPVLITLDAPADHDALAEACRRLVARHPLLGSAVQEYDGVPRFEPAAVQPELGTAGSADEVITRQFDLEKGPLVRFALVGERTLVVVAHHLVFDGASKDLLVADLAAYYQGREPEQLPELPGSGGQRERIEAAQAEATRFWAPRWLEPGPVTVPGGTLRSRAASSGLAHEFPLEIPELDGLTRFETLVAAVHTLLAAYGNAEVVTALDLSTRTGTEAGRIGSYVNELPLHSSPTADTPFLEFAAGLRSELREVYRYREVPIARAVPGLRPHAALAPVSISYRRTPDGGWPGGEVQWLAFNHSVRGALQLQVAQGERGAVASLRHDPRELADPARFAGDLTRLLAAVAAGSALPLGELTPFQAGTGGDARAADARTADAPADVDVEVDVDVDDPLVAQVRAIWEQVLDLSPIAPDDDIFDLGGHSLTITQIIARMQRQLRVEISLDDFFDNPTIAGVVAVVRS